MKNRYGRLIVVGEPFRRKDTPTSKVFRTYVKAKCDCGNSREYRLSHLKSGGIQSCGCFRKEVSIKRFTIHGYSKHPLTNVWRHMKDRCYKKSDIAYENYGGRGIEVCREWRNNFNAFCTWCLANGWEKGLTIDREDNDGNYEPGNCRFVTQKQNNRNKRNTLKLSEVQEVRKLYSTGKYTMEKLGRMYDVGTSTICAIITKQNWK